MQDCIIYRHSQPSEYETQFSIDKEQDNLYERLDEARIKEILEQVEVIHNLHADETSNAIYMRLLKMLKYLLLVMIIAKSSILNVL